MTQFEQKREQLLRDYHDGKLSSVEYDELINQMYNGYDVYPYKPLTKEIDDHLCRETSSQHG